MRNFGFPAEFIEEVRQKNDIVSVISRSLTLEKKGRNFWACCPFHFEKTPSFAVSQDEQFYHCYGCGESGDVIKFVEKYENLNFIEAIKFLAKEAGLQLPQFESSQKDLERLRTKEKVLRALALAKEFYCNSIFLPANKSALDYAKSRGFDAEILKKFGIGVSPDWQGLVEFLQKNKIDLKIMNLAGLVDFNSQNKPYDVFAKRLTFPISNAFSDVIGFTARTLEKNPNFAKYRNSAQTIVFDKSRTIYNIDNIKALKKQQKLDCIIVCEGTIDVIAMHRAGIENACACMGTAITPFHAKELSKYSSKIVLCLDGDSAGQHAMFKAIDVLCDAGLEVTVAKLQNNLDPDEFLDQFGKEALQSAIKQTVDCVEFKIDCVAQKFDLKTNVGATKFVAEAVEIIKPLPTNAQKELYLKLVSQKTKIPMDVLRRDVFKDHLNKENPKNDDDATQKVLVSRPQGHLRAEQFVLACVVFKKPFANNLNKDEIKFKNPSFQNLFDFVMSAKQQSKTFTISTLYDFFDIDQNEDLKQILSFNFAQFDGHEEEYFFECLNKIKLDNLKILQDELGKQFKLEVDPQKKRDIALKLNNIAKEIKFGDKKNV